MKIPRRSRIGNAAHRQLQLDVYGELFDSIYQARKGGVASDENGWALQVAVLGDLEKRWREPDNGIWEVRSERQHFTHSKVMAWLRSIAASRASRRSGVDGAAQTIGGSCGRNS